MTDNERNRLKISHKEYAETLGFKHYGQATRLLNKIVLINAAKTIGKGNCPGCHKEITTENLTIGHILPWRRTNSREGDASLFWNIDNILLECKDCNRPDEFPTGQGIIADPVDHECNFAVTRPEIRRMLNFAHDLLGAEFGKSNHQLRRLVMFEWSKQAGFLDNCFQCTHSITDANHFTIEHKIPWLSGKDNQEKYDLFFSLENLSSSHLVCNASAANIGTGISELNGVDFYLNKKTGYSSWRARIMIGGISTTIKHSQDKIECGEAYDMAVLKYRNGHGILNYPEKADYYVDMIENGWHEDPVCRICGDKHYGCGYCRKHHREFILGQIPRGSRPPKQCQPKPRPNKSGFRCVEIINEETGIARGKINYRSHTVDLGTFENAIIAAEMVDIANIKYDTKTKIINFPEKIDTYKHAVEKGITFEGMDLLIEQLKNNPEGRVISKALGSGKSKYKGVTYRKNKRGEPVLQMTYSQKGMGKISRSNGMSEERLAELYDLCAVKYRDGLGGLNFPLKLQDYKKELEVNPNIV